MTIYSLERDIQEWPEWSVSATTIDEVPTGTERAVFYRERNSHKGISSRSQLKKLKAIQVNQHFFEEICELTALEYLDLDVVTIEDLTSISRLKNLKTIKLSGIRKLENFGDITRLPHLNKLFIENAKNLKSLDFLSNANGLKSIGIEGSMWTKQKIETLKPLASLAKLEALFMTSVHLEDKDLSYLSSCPKLKVLQCARFAPKSQFEKLRTLMPELACNWCDRYELE